MAQGRKYIADEEIQPIAVTIGGKNYLVKEVTEEMLEEVMEIGRIATEGGKVKELRILSRQLAVLLDVDEEEFSGVDIRKLMGAVNFIQQEITASAEGSTKKA